MVVFFLILLIVSEMFLVGASTSRLGTIVLDADIILFTVYAP